MPKGGKAVNTSQTGDVIKNNTEEVVDGIWFLNQPNVENFSTKELDFHEFYSNSTNNRDPGSVLNHTFYIDVSREGWLVPSQAYMDIQFTLTGKTTALDANDRVIHSGGADFFIRGFSYSIQNVILENKSNWGVAGSTLQLTNNGYSKENEMFGILDDNGENLAPASSSYVSGDKTFNNAYRDKVIKSEYSSLGTTNESGADKRVFQYRIPLYHFIDLFKYRKHAWSGLQHKLTLDLYDTTTCNEMLLKTGTGTGVSFKLDRLSLWMPSAVPSETINDHLIQLKASGASEKIMWENCNTYLLEEGSNSQTINKRIDNIPTSVSKVVVWMKPAQVDWKVDEAINRHTAIHHIKTASISFGGKRVPLQAYNLSEDTYIRTYKTYLEVNNFEPGDEALSFNQFVRAYRFMVFDLSVLSNNVTSMSGLTDLSLNMTRSGADKVDIYAAVWSTKYATMSYESGAMRVSNVLGVGV